MDSQEAALLKAWDGYSEGDTPVHPMFHYAWKAALEWAAKGQESIIVTGKLGERCSFTSNEAKKGDCVYLHPAPIYPLPDDFYPGSKDWMHSDYAGRVEWLHVMYESKKKEADYWIDVANRNIPAEILAAAPTPNVLTIRRDTLQDILGALAIAMPASAFGERKLNQAIADCEAILAAAPEYKE